MGGRHEACIIKRSSHKGARSKRTMGVGYREKGIVPHKNQTRQPLEKP